MSGKCANDEDRIIGDDFVGTKINNIAIISNYKSPNCTPEEFAVFMEDLISMRKEKCGPMILAGDFNSKSAAWGSRINDIRGDVLLESITDMKLIPVVTKGGNSFERIRDNRVTGSKIDIMSCDSKIFDSIISSQVMKEDSGSDHKYVMHTINDKIDISNEDSIACYNIWNEKPLNEDLFKTTMYKYFYRNKFL